MKFFIFLTAFVISAHAEIIQCSTMKDVQAKVEMLRKGEADPQNISVVIDTKILVHPKDPEASLSAMKMYQAELDTILNTPKKRDLALTWAQTLDDKGRLRKDGADLMEQDSPAVIRDIRKTGVRVFGFTTILNHYPTRKENTRTADGFYDILQKLGLEFTSLEEEVKIPSNGGRSEWNTIFKKSPVLPLYANPVIGFGPGFSPKIGMFEMCGEPPTLKKGTPRYNRSILLDCVFQTLARDYSPLMPKVLLFVDSDQENLQKMEMYFKEKHPNMVFIGMEYQGSKQEKVSKEAFQSYWKKLLEKSLKKYYLYP